MTRNEKRPEKSEDFRLLAGGQPENDRRAEFVREDEK